MESCPHSNQTWVPNPTPGCDELRRSDADNADSIADEAQCHQFEVDGIRLGFANAAQRCQFGLLTHMPTFLLTRPEGTKSRTLKQSARETRGLRGCGGSCSGTSGVRSLRLVRTCTLIRCAGTHPRDSLARSLLPAVHTRMLR